MKKILVTGGTGFLGSNIAAGLREAGFDVRVLRRQSSSLRALEGVDVEFAIGDIRDIEAVRRAVRGCDTVFHTAALVSYWRRQREEMYEVNIGGTRTVVDACLQEGVEKLVHTSSIAAIGFPGNGMPADESTPFNWDEYDIGYRISKHRAEQEIHRGVEKGLPAVIVNPSVILGERDINFNGGQIVRDVYKKRIFYYTTGGTSIVYVGDVVRGHLSAARQGRTGERYILCGKNLSHHEIVSVTADVVGGLRPFARLPMWLVRTIASASETYANLTNTKPWIGKELINGINLHCRFSCEKAQRELGYSVTPFRVAVQNTFNWYRQHHLL